MARAKIKLCGLSHTVEALVSPKFGTIERNGQTLEVTSLALEAPVSGTVVGTLLNYKGELAALGNKVTEPPYMVPPKAPVLYVKPINTLIGYGMPIPLPSGIAELQIGAALGVVIGRTAVRVREADALEHVYGYTVVNDVSIPHDSIYRPAVSLKARDGFCPVGPWVVECEAVRNPDALGIRVFINGELRQENSTSNLIRSVSRLLADVTDFMTLFEGDTLLVGVPEGAPKAVAGDCVRIEIDDVGSLENRIVPEDELVLEGLK